MGNAEGAKNPPNAQGPSSADARPAQERRTAWIGKSVFVQGNVVSDEDLTIDGKLEGTITVGNHSLTVGADAAIHADLNARSIVVSGTVTGNLTATERIEIHETASVEGDIAAPRLNVQAGAVLHGRIDTGASTQNVRTFPVAV